jgi:hypothetical protein
MLKLSAKSIVSTPCFYSYYLYLKLLFRFEIRKRGFYDFFYDLKWKDRLHVVLIFCLKFSKPITAFP